MGQRSYDIWVPDGQSGRVRQTVVEIVDDAVLAAEANELALRAQAATALATNVTFLALAAPTNAQTVAQVRALTRECSTLIRLLVRLLDSTDGT